MKHLTLVNFLSITFALTFSLLFASSASAISYDFSSGSSALTGTNGNVRSFVGSDGSTVRVTAFNTSTVVETSSLVASYLGHYSGGLGVTATTSDGSHTVDNSGFTDFVLFEFAFAVDPVSTFLTAFNDTDMTAWLGNNNTPNLSLAGVGTGGFAGLGFTSLGDFSGDTTSRTVNFNTALTGKYLIIAPNLLSDNDEFKIKNLNVTAVPEPLTSGLLLMGMFGVGKLKRRDAGEDAGETV